MIFACSSRHLSIWIHGVFLGPHYTVLPLIFITPETLFNSAIQDRLSQIQIGLFVIDEAHCISDWGHDFRLEYSRLNITISNLPADVPVLATTATANNRVIADLEKQLGDNVFVTRGPLARESLCIQVMSMPDVETRYAWLAENIPRLQGSGIIYCLTKRDCDHLSQFLRKHGISAKVYYSRNDSEEELNRSIEEDFKYNRIKVIVATIKLGMVYDKGDIAFVVHFQMPANIVSYYQQIGRAGRNIDRAYAFLMYSKEDEDILQYFINTAFPSEKETQEIVRCLETHGGLSKNDLSTNLNINGSHIKKALSFLQHDGFVFKDATRFYLSPKPFYYDAAYYSAITDIRRKEMEQFKELAHTVGCFSQYVTACLDDQDAHPCGNCVNCIGHELLPSTVSPERVTQARAYIDSLTLSIQPRKKWAATSITKSSKIKYINQEGLCLSQYGRTGYGVLVKNGKYFQKKRFCDELVGASVNFLAAVVKEKGIQAVCYVPSLRSNLVEDFSERLSQSLGIPVMTALQKLATLPQKAMENSSHQCQNALQSFKIIPDVALPANVLLVDDVVDSGWTLTLCGYLLMEAGCECVYPFALADSSRKTNY